MACRIVTLGEERVESQAWEDIYNQVESEQEADSIYDNMFTDSFMQWYGVNWTLVGEEPTIVTGAYQNLKGELRGFYETSESISSVNGNLLSEEVINNKKAYEVKSGVQELFESNPELANAVYESLGFKQFKFEHLSKYSNLSDFTLNKKEEAVNFLQSLDGKKLFSPSEMLSRISNADTSRINKGLSDYLNSILEQYQGIYAEELINPYRIEFKEQLKLGDDRDDTIGDLRGYNQAGYKAINLTNIESNDLIKTILHEFVHDIEPYVLFKESKLIRFTKTKGSNTPLTEEQLKIGNQLENLRKLVIKHLAEEFKNKKPDSLKNEIERLENGGLITIYGELKKPMLVYINNLKNELNAVNRLIETNKVEEFIENNKQFFLNNEYNHYGVTNLNEFITEALTNDKFRKLLNEIPYKNTTILSYLFELFQKILGIKKDTVLSEALNLIHEVATTKRGQLRDFQITQQQKQQAQQQYASYLDTIFPDSKIEEIDDSLYNSVLNQLEQENKIEKDCSGGKLKAKDGLRTKFTKGSQWEIVKDLKGYPSHSQGGVDVKIGKNGFSFTRDNGVIEAKYGLVLPKIK
jgi:ubiquitin